MHYQLTLGEDYPRYRLIIRYCDWVITAPLMQWLLDFRGHPSELQLLRKRFLLTQGCFVLAFWSEMCEYPPSRLLLMFVTCGTGYTSLSFWDRHKSVEPIVSSIVKIVTCIYVFVYCMFLLEGWQQTRDHFFAILDASCKMAFVLHMLV